MIARDNVTVVVDEDEIRNADLSEVHAEGIDPEMVGPFRIPSGYMSRDAFVKTVPGEQTECGGQALFAMLTLLSECSENRRGWHRDVLLDDDGGHSGW